MDDPFIEMISAILFAFVISLLLAQHIFSTSRSLSPVATQSSHVSRMWNAYVSDAGTLPFVPSQIGVFLPPVLAHIVAEYYCYIPCKLTQTIEVPIYPDHLAWTNHFLVCASSMQLRLAFLDMKQFKPVGKLHDLCKYLCGMCQTGSDEVCVLTTARLTWYRNAELDIKYAGLDRYKDWSVVGYRQGHVFICSTNLYIHVYDNESHLCIFTIAPSQIDAKYPVDLPNIFNIYAMSISSDTIAIRYRKWNMLILNFKWHESEKFYVVREHCKLVCHNDECDGPIWSGYEHNGSRVWADLAAIGEDAVILSRPKKKSLEFWDTKTCTLLQSVIIDQDIGHFVISSQGFIVASNYNSNQIFIFK